MWPAVGDCGAVFLVRALGGPEKRRFLFSAVSTEKEGGCHVTRPLGRSPRYQEEELSLREQAGRVLLSRQGL